jgi:HTH-type transcriptional regulator, sugar sensing transcriptional regulator
MEEELREFGLTDKEIKVYLAALKLGSALVQEIAENAGTYRTYTYDVLKSLKEKGLVSHAVKSGKQYFEVAEPEKLLNVLKEKENKINGILPELKNLYKSVSEKPKIEIYEGKEGLKTMLDDIIRTKKEILVYGSTKKQLDLLKFYFPNFIKRRVEEKIKTKVITENSKEAREINKKNKEKFREVRFLSKEIEFSTATNIYGDKVAILSLENDIFGIIIENKNIADTQRTIFNMFWKMASE